MIAQFELTMNPVCSCWCHWFFKFLCWTFVIVTHSTLLVAFPINRLNHSQALNNKNIIHGTFEISFVHFTFSFMSPCLKCSCLTLNLNPNIVCSKPSRPVFKLLYCLTNSRGACWPLMNHVNFTAGFDLPDVQLMLTLSLIWYRARPPVILGSVSGNTEMSDKMSETENYSTQSELEVFNYCTYFSDNKRKRIWFDAWKEKLLATKLP